MIHDEGAKKVAELIGLGTEIISLDLSILMIKVGYNEITNAGLLFILHELPNNSCIKYLNLGNNIVVL